MEDRKFIVKKLVSFKDPRELPLLMKALKTYPWDSDPLVTLSMQDVSSTLKRYLQADLTAEDVHNWADAIEMRDDIECGNEGFDREAVTQIIMRLASPELEGPLTKDRAQSVIQLFSGSRIPTAEETDNAYANKR